MYLPDGPSFKIINTEVTLCNLMHIFSYLDNNKHRHAQTWNKYLWLEGKARLSNWDIIAALCSLTLIVNICNQFLWQKLKKIPITFFSSFISLGAIKKLCRLKIGLLTPSPLLLSFLLIRTNLVICLWELQFGGWWQNSRRLPWFLLPMCCFKGTH